MRQGVMQKLSIGAVCVGIMLLFSGSVSASRFSSSSYVIDASVANNFGGQESSASYKLVGSGGESIVGTSASTSYKMGMGYTAQLLTSIELTVNQPSISFPTVSPGTPETVDLIATINTDAPGYTLAINQNNNLDDGAGHTIPKIAASIASPQTWTDGTTTGLGFTIASATGGVPAAWTAGTKFAAMPDTTPTTFFTRSVQPSGPENVTLRYKIGVDLTNIAATYTNVATLTGTMTP